MSQCVYTARLIMREPNASLLWRVWTDFTVWNCYFISDSEKGWILNFMASMKVIFLVLYVSHKDWMLSEVSSQSYSN